MGADWFRNSTWDRSIAQAFDTKLRRARKKGQYLRIQASTLARTHPEVALSLLDRYFELSDDCFDNASAHCDRATALIALGRLTEALDAYESALARELRFPNVQTQACLEFPYLVAIRRIRDRYSRALELLQPSESGLSFPLDHFRWHAARALIAAESDESEIASVHARQALEAASREHSGLRYHPLIGLVTAEYDDVISQLNTLCAL